MYVLKSEDWIYASYAISMKQFVTCEHYKIKFHLIL